MSGSFESFQVASRGMAASQATINVTGNNVANVNTEGYTRQRVDVDSVTISGSVQKYATPQISTGRGAEAVGTSQSRDPYVDTRYRAQNAKTSAYDTMKSSLMNLEDVFDEADTEALQGELSSFINDLQSLSETPTSSDIAQVVRSSAQKVTQYINMYSNQIEDARKEQTEDLGIVKDSFNTYVKNIASLNEQIQKEEIYGNTPNELYDQRNLLIDKLSAIGNIKVSTEKVDKPGFENLNISTLSITLGGTTIVSNDRYAELKTNVNADSTVTLSLTDANGGYTADANSKFSDGSVKAYLDIINGKGSFADLTKGESDVRGISYYSESMDIFAKTFASVLNKINGYDATTTPVTGSPLFTSDGTSTTGITAANIQVSTAWLDNPKTIVTSTDTTNTGTTSGKADNVLRMISALNSKDQTYLEADGTTQYGSKRSFHEYITGLLGELSTDVELYGNFSTTANGVLDTISTTRDETSGVSLNEEGVNLTAFQKVYNATIRYFNVLDENLDKIINTMGV
jgi:flagellar hook-associated protein 1 FlgK